MKRNRALFALILAAALPVLSCGGRDTPSPFWYGKSDAARQINTFLAHETGVSWSTGGHTANPVPLLLGGSLNDHSVPPLMDQPDLHAIMVQALEQKKSLILVIGDGMGVNAFSIPFSMKKSDKVPGGFRRLAGISRLSLVMTRPHGPLVTDSAASGTALATGEVTRRGMISQDPEGRSRETLMERARKGGFLTGIITDTRITHATPAVFYSHIHDRNREGEIALQLVKGGPDLFLGGGAAYFIPQGTRLEDAVPGRRWKGTSRRKDKRNLLDELTRRGRNLVFTGKELKQAAGLPLGGFFASSHLPYAADRQGERDVPGLDEMTARALDLMADTGRPFFLVIECGRIDHAAHANDMGTLVHAMAEMDRVLMVLAPLVEQNTGNLALVVTSDHETGGPVITSFRGKEPVETALPDGRRVREWERSPHPADLEKYLDQEASREEILKGSGSPDELYENFRETMPYPLTRQEAQKVYELWKNRNR